MSTNIDLAIQPLLVGAMVSIKNVFYSGYTLDSPHLWIDVALQAGAKLFSAGVTMEFIIPSIGSMGRIADPVIQGAITGGVKELFLDSSNINALRFVGSGAGLPQPEDYSFETGFVEGLTYGGISTTVAFMAEEALGED